MKIDDTNKKTTIRYKSKRRTGIKNKELYLEICKSLEQDKLTDDAVDMLVYMCNNATKKLKYKYPEDREDCISTAKMKCLLYWRNFKPELSKNAFAYFTQVIKNGYAEEFNRLRPIKDSDIISLSDENIHLF